MPRSQSTAPATFCEPNDDAGKLSSTVWTHGFGTINATLDYWEDPVDVYRIKLKKKQHLTLFLNGPQGTDSSLVLWRPGTKSVRDLSPAAQKMRVAQSRRRGGVERIKGFRARRGGWYYVEVRMAARLGPASGSYQLTYHRTSFR